MEASEQNLIDTLQELTQFVNDGRAGYEQAAKESTNPQHQQLYQSLSDQRAEFARELNQAIQEHGGQAQTHTTAKGKIYRQWMDLKAAVTSKDEVSIISSNLHGEEWAQKAYAQALAQSDLPDPLRQLIQRQKLASEQTFQTLKQMKEGILES